MDEGPEPRVEGLEPDTSVLGAATGPEMAVVSRGTYLGRYWILSRLGAGGMGAVYSAYDPQLDRKVALKLLHLSAQDRDNNAPARLIREAQAMARLSHPNAVAVYDVGSWNGQLFLAMELVEGQTLSQWLGERPRHWRDVVTLFEAAGQGLAAAHAVGIVHRDFKPSNVLIGQDGRPRVTDFGLARAVGAGAPPREDTPHVEPPAQIDRLATPLTQAGSAVGTPGYMAPEQYDGQAADARSDQYGFCSALYEALYGEPAFRGGPYEIAAQAASGKLPTPPRHRHVPGWVQRIVLRGLASDPNERYPTMEALLGDLAKDRTALRRRWALGAGAVMLVVGLGIAYGQVAERRSLVCKGAERKLSSVWDGAKKQAIEKAFLATGKSYARDAWATVERLLDKYAADWVSMHTEACEATRVRHVQSDELLSLKMACLQERLAEARALTDLYAHADAKLVENATKAANGLSWLSDCGQTETLLSPIKPPSDPATRAQVDALRTKLAEVKALRAAGRLKQGMEQVKPLVAQAEQLGYGPLQAEALSLRGAFENGMADFPAAEKTLADAVAVAESGRHDRIAADAAIQLIEVVAYAERRFDEGTLLARHAEVLLTRLGAGDKLEVAYLVTLASVRYAENDFAGLLLNADRARELVEAAPDDYDRLTSVKILNLSAIALFVTGRYDEGLQGLLRAVTTAERELGPRHPNNTTLLGNVAFSYLYLGRYQQGQAYAERALDVARNELGPAHARTGWVTSILGATLVGRGRSQEAADALRTALATLENAYGPRHGFVAYADSKLGDALRDLGRIREARRRYARAIASFEGGPNPQDSDLDGALAGLAELYLRLGKPNDAIPLLERATQMSSGQRWNMITRAEMRFALARALAQAGRDRERAVALAREAREIFVAIRPDDGETRVAQVDAWLRLHGG